VPSPVLTPTAEPTRPAPTATPASTPVRLAAAGFGQQGRTVAFGFAVENPNPGVGLEGIDYRVTAIGPGQGVLGVANGRVPVVGAGERRGVAGTLELAADAVVSAVTVDLTPGRPATTAAPAQVAAEGATWRDDGGRPRVVGVVVNSSGQPSGRLLVTALVLDPRGTIVGSGSTSLGPVPANGRANVEVPVVAARSVNEVELYVAPE
jgi:hypothetical protein